MVRISPKTSKKGLYAAIAGTVLVALCCFTPLVVILMAAIGLTALTPYLDYILLPALGIMAIVTVLSYLRYRKTG